MSDGRAVDRALVLLGAGDLEQAERLLVEWLTYAPDDAWAHLALADIGLTSHRPLLAERHARRALEQEQTRPLAAMQLATLCEQGHGTREDGLQWALYSANLDPQRSSLRQVLATRLYDTGDKQQALLQARSAVALAPRDPTERARALGRFAEFCLRESDWQREGRRAAEDAVALDPDEPNIARVLGLLQIATWQSSAGLLSIMGAARRSPADPRNSSLISIALYGVLMRALTWSTVVTWALVLTGIGVGATNSQPPVVARWTSSAIVGATALTWLLCLRGLTAHGVRRDVWEAARRRSHSWVIGIALTMIMAAFAVVSLTADYYLLWLSALAMCVLWFGFAAASPRGTPPLQ